MNVLYFYIFILVHPYLSMWWKSFELAGHKPWEALIPGHNYYIAFKISCKKPFWAFLMVFPGAHLVMLAVLNVSYIRRFGYFTLLDTLQGIFFPYIIMAKIAQSKDQALPETNWANSKEVGNREWGDHLVLFLTVPVIGHAIALTIASVTRPKPGKKTRVKEWGDSLLFALVAASIIRTYVFEPFQIPTGSMEKTLVVGDFLFVNKLAYGPKVPVTPLSYPLVHNTIPWVNVKSYTGLETSDYTRLPGFSSIERNDVVVFNYPSGDTAVYDPRMPMGLMGHNYHDLVIKEAKRIWLEENPHISKIKSYLEDSVRNANPGQNIDRVNLSNWADEQAHARIWDYNDQGLDFIDNIEIWKAKARKRFAEDRITHDDQGNVIEHYGLIDRPVDKRENYIKRCVGVPGDWLEIDSSILYVNDKPAMVAKYQNLLYQVDNFTPYGPKRMAELFEIEAESDYQYAQKEDGTYVLVGVHTNLATVAKLRKRFPDAKFVLSINEQYSDTTDQEATASQMIDNLKFFPNDPYINNTVSDFNRFQVPSKGQTIKLTKEKIAWYRRIITAYEGHTLSEKEDGFYIDGKKATTYTFTMNYYWMMGDNRYNSADSRMWGFVPEDHIVGKASMVWFSKSPYAGQGVRWDRLFNVIE